MSGARPRWTRRLLAALAHPLDRRFVLADLDEGFERRAAVDVRAARSWCRAQVARSALPLLRGRLERLPAMRHGNLLADVRRAVRGMVSEPVLGLVIVASLATGIAVTVSVFAAANAFLLRPPSASVREPERLATVFTSTEEGTAYGQNSWLDFESVADQATVFEEVTASRLGFVRVRRGDEEHSAIIEIVAGNYFDVLGIQAAHGRTFRADETRLGASERVVVISHRLWRERFDGSANALGEELMIDGNPFVVIGVAPEDLISRFLSLRVDAWLPAGVPGGVFRVDAESLADRRDRDFGVLGRLRAGATHELAQGELDLIAARLVASHPFEWQDTAKRPLRFTVMDEQAARVPPDAKAGLATLSLAVLATALLVLGIACSNVAGLLLARGERRRHEIAVRRALGASRGRLVAMLLTENLLFALLAGGAGIVAARALLRSFQSVTLPIGGVTLQFDLRVDGTVLAFALLLSVATSIFFGLVPSLRVTDGHERALLRGGTATAGRRRQWLRSGLVAAQVAAAMIFVVGAITALRSVRQLSEMDWGIRADRFAVASLRAPVAVEDDELVAWYRELVDRASSQPGVRAAHITRSLEGSAFAIDALAEIHVPGHEPATDESMTAPYNSVSAGYMQAIDVSLLAGRTFLPGDDGAGALVAVVSNGMAHRYWPDGNALGSRFHLVSDRREGEATGLQQEYEVIGIAADAMYRGFEDGPMLVDAGSTGNVFFWIPLEQRPVRDIVLAVEAEGDPASLLPWLQSQVEETGTRIAIVVPQRYRDLIDYQFAFVGTAGRVLAVCGSFGLVLACFGIYGILGYTLRMRMRELAIRQALGARPAQIFSSLLCSGLGMTAAGAVLGLAAGLPMISLLRSELPGLSPVDPLAVAVGVVVLSAAATLASWLPARRASGIDPVEALRQE